MDSITINDEVIVSYYRENPNIDIVVMNHIFIDILKNLSSNLSNTINTTINTQILSIVSEINKNLTIMKSDLIIKFHESKKDYIEDIKSIVQNNILSNNEKINSLIERSNDHFLSKTTSIINEIIPKSQESVYNNIDNSIKNFCSTITKDTTKLIELNTLNNNNNLTKNITDNIEKSFTNMIVGIQQTIFNYIKSSEDRTTSEIQKMRENFISQQSVQNNLTNELKEHLNKYKNNSSYKGAVSEKDLHDILISILPTDEIIKVSSDTATCDFRVNRKDTTKPSILFENKYYKNRSTPTEEVKKFERDVQLQKIHGVFLSQESPITFKDKFQIDIINGLIHIYIPNAEYDSEKIKIAIDIIDNLSLKLNSLSNTSNNELSINKEELEELVEEYHVFAFQKSQMLDTIRLVNKQLTDKLEEIQLPKFKKFLIKLGNIENDNDFKCTFCNNWSGKNKASLAAHVRSCKFNPKNKDYENTQELKNGSEEKEEENIEEKTKTPENTEEKTKTPEIATEKTTEKDRKKHKQIIISQKTN